MKKISMAVLLGVMSVGAAMAEFNGPTATETVVVKENVAKNPKGGFVDTEEVIVTIKQAKEMRDDVPVVLKGKIVQRMGDEKFLFEDSTGSITVEIDDEDWGGQTVSPTDIVILYGEVDRGIFSTEIDVEDIKKM